MHHEVNDEDTWRLWYNDHLKYVACACKIQGEKGLSDNFLISNLIIR